MQRDGNKGEIKTFSGLSFNPLEPNLDKICVEDIAHALSLNTRFGGHCPKFYSVAEHSILVMGLMEAGGYGEISQFAGLMHDAEEAYLMDMPSPIKQNFQNYVDAGVSLRKAIWQKYNIPWSFYDATKPYDNEAYFLERKRLWDGKTNPMTSEVAEVTFLNEFQRLQKRIGGSGSRAA